MITYVNTRNGVSVTRTLDIGDALQMLVRYEIGYGGRVTGYAKEGSHATIRLTTMLDNVKFSGDMEQMSLLLQVTYIWHHLMGDRQTIGMRGLKEAAEIDGRASFITTFGLLFVGKNLATMIYLEMIGVRDEEEAQLFAAKDLGTLHALLMMRLSGDSLTELLELVKA